MKHALCNGTSGMVHLVNVLVTNHVAKNYVLNLGKIGILLLSLVAVMITLPITQKAIVAQKNTRIIMKQVNVLKIAQVYGKRGILELKVVNVLITFITITQKAIVAKNTPQIIY
jgi:hypothetical protein